jgi:hypothetical protein
MSRRFIRLWGYLSRVSDVVIVAAITGATGVLGGFFGFQASRAQIAIEARKLDHEVSAREATFEKQAKEERRELYLEYMGAIDEAWKLVGRSPLTEAMYNSWWESYAVIDNRVELFAGGEIRDAAFPLWKVLNAYVKDVSTLAENSSVEKAAPEAWGRHADAVHERRADLLAAMRREVGAPGA